MEPPNDFLCSPISAEAFMRSSESSHLTVSPDQRSDSHRLSRGSVSNRASAEKRYCLYFARCCSVLVSASTSSDRPDLLRATHSNHIKGLYRQVRLASLQPQKQLWLSRRFLNQLANAIGNLGPVSAGLHPRVDSSK